MAFLQGNLALLLGLIGFVATLLARQLSRSDDFRQNIGGAVVWFGVFLGVRLNYLWLEGVLPAAWNPFMSVVWMLAFAYGSVRTTVAIVLWVRQRFRTQPTAKIHRDVVDFVLYVLVTIPILKTQLKLDVTTLLGTSAVLSIVLGLALQDTLGNLFSGLSLQLERPYQVSDFIQVGQQTGQVVQIAWRSTRLESVRGEALTIPNSLIAKERVTNFTSGGKPIGIDLYFGASYDAPPNTVKAEVLEVLREVPLVLDKPAPTCRAAEFADSSVKYLVRFYLLDYATVPTAYDEIFSRLWYRFGRAGIEIPFPQRVITTKTPKESQEKTDDELLRSLEVLVPFTAQERAAIAASAVVRRFGRGEEVVTEGREGQTFYVVLSGRVSVRVGQRELATLARGQVFGEMALLTGEPRVATVVALDDCVLFELDRPAFARHFAEHPERAKELAGLLAARKAELAELSSTTKDESVQNAGRILERLKQIFRVRE